MTIIQPTKSKRMINFFITLLAGSVVGISLWGIVLYNEVVDARHEKEKRETALRAIEVKNSELKNSVYETMSPKQLESIREARALVAERNPHYIKAY